MKIRVTANLTIDEVIDCDDSMTDEERSNYLWEYVCQNIVLHLKEVEK